MTDFYFSNAGDDSAAGTESAPWATREHLQHRLNTQDIGPGDTVHLQRGGLWHGTVDQAGHTDQDAGWVTFRPYGYGRKPRFSSYKRALVNGWTEMRTGVWRINLDIGSGAYTGNQSDKAGIGHLLVDERTVRGHLRWSEAELSDEWDFCSSGVHGYVRHDGNPSSDHTVDIAVTGPWSEATGSPDAWVPAPRTRITGLDIFGSGAGGVQSSSYWTAHHVQVSGCDIHHVGGGAFDDLGNGRVRGGNGVQAWIGSEDWTIEGNRIWQCYDAAISYQGTEGEQIPGNRGWRRCHSRRNTIFDNGQSFESWATGSSGHGSVECSFVDNTCLGAGRGWGHATRPDPDGRGCHVLLYQHDLPNDLLIAGNAFYWATTNHVFALNGVPAGVVLRDNHVLLAPGTLIQTSTNTAGRRPETIEESAAYVAGTGNERGTAWYSESDLVRAGAALPTWPR